VVERRERGGREAEAAAKKEGEECSVRFRVRFAETDAMQVAYYAEYFVWFEVAKTELFRSRGLSYDEIRERGLHTPVVRAVADYKASAQYDDEINVKAWTSKIGRSSVHLEYEVTKEPEHELLCTGKTVHVFIGSDGKPRWIPADFRRKLSAQLPR
jgi:acyl-CoA thioester hydrolase